MAPRAVGIAEASARVGLRPYSQVIKPKRRTRAAITREKELGRWSRRSSPTAGRRPTLAAPYVTDEVPNAKEALAGARDILTRASPRTPRCSAGCARSCSKARFWPPRVVKGQEEKGAKFSDFSPTANAGRVPSHRAPAMMRGANDGVLTLGVGAGPGAGCRRSTPWSRPRLAADALDHEREVAGVELRKGRVAAQACLPRSPPPRCRSPLRPASLPGRRCRCHRWPRG